MYRVGGDTPYTLANSRYTAPPKSIFIYDMYGIPHGMPTNIPLTNSTRTTKTRPAHQSARRGAGAQDCPKDKKQAVLPWK